MNLFIKQTHRLKEQSYGYQEKRVGVGEDRLGVWDWHVHTGIFKIKWDKNLISKIYK